MSNREQTNQYHSWWYCDNILNHPEQIGLLRMDFPRVFILMRNYFHPDAPNDFEQWRKEVSVTFFNKEDSETADLDEILTDAWNFLALTEEEEERQAILAEEDDILDDDF